MTRRALTLEERIARAITNPGSVVAPAPPPAGGLDPHLHWQARAVLEVTDRHYRHRLPGRWWLTEKAYDLLDGKQQPPPSVSKEAH